jgi:hypothetical protein
LLESSPSIIEDSDYEQKKLDVIKKEKENALVTLQLQKIREERYKDLGFYRKDEPTPEITAVVGPVHSVDSSLVTPETIEEEEKEVDADFPEAGLVSLEGLKTPAPVLSSEEITDSAVSLLSSNLFLSTHFISQYRKKLIAKNVPWFYD